VIVASPAYLARFGTPDHPNALLDHRIVGGSASAVPNAWRFERFGGAVTVDLEPGFSTNENEGAIAAAVAGIGVTSTNAWACRREMDDELLVRLLPEWATIEIPVFAFYPMGRATRAVGRALVDHLKDDLRQG
jgi:DNA-binding transcriptional LysR family regulator